MKQLSPQHVPAYRHANDILEVVSIALNLEIDALKSAERLRPLAEARQIYAYITRKEAIMLIPMTVASEVINRDHATIIYGAREAENLNTTNKDFARKMERCIAVYKSKYRSTEINDYNFIPQY